MLEQLGEKAMAESSNPSLGTAVSSSMILMGLGWLFIRTKLDSIGLLWKRLDELRDVVNANRLTDVEKYATRAEVEKMLDRLEAHFDKRFDDLERKLESRGNT